MNHTLSFIGIRETLKFLHPTDHEGAFGERPGAVVVGRFIGEHAEARRVASPHLDALLGVDAVELGLGHFFVLRLEKLPGVPMPIDLMWDEFIMTRVSSHTQRV